MLDLKLIRDNPEGFDAALKKRGLEPLSEVILKLDTELLQKIDALQRQTQFGQVTAAIMVLDIERRQILSTLQDAQSRRNQISKDVGKAKAAKREDEAQKLMSETGTLKEVIQSGESDERRISGKLLDLLARISNMPAEDVPVGDESANEEIRRWRDKPNFAFQPKQHFELGEALGLMDFETAASLSGSRFVVLRGALAKLERALANFMLNLHTEEFGYEEVNPPLLVKDPAMFGTGQLPKFIDDLFSTEKRVDGFETFEEFVQGFLPKAFARLPVVQKEYKAVTGREMSIDEALSSFQEAVRQNVSEMRELYEERKAQLTRLWMIPTAEVSLTNLVRESILDPAALPMRVTAHTPCFRSEAGSAGKDTRGMIRLHQFSKVELVSITTPEQSEAEHERMTACAEEVLKRLGLAYRTMVLATGDMGFSARKTYDIEVWLPGQNAYREISSCSNCGDFQARRMNARYRPEGAKDVRFVHTLNGSALAVGRTLVAILENYQQQDGSIRIPDVLVPYMGGLELIRA